MTHSNARGRGFPPGPGPHNASSVCLSVSKVSGLCTKTACTGPVLDRWVDDRMDGGMEEWIDEWMEEWVDGRMDR